METRGEKGLYRMSDALWAQIQPLLPKHVNTHRFGGGRPRADERTCMDAILFVLRTGCQWGALDATGLCPHSTAHDRFQQWCQAGVFQKLWALALKGYDELKGIDWSWQAMDGAMTKAPLGGEKNRAESHRSGQTGRQAQSPHGRPRHSHRRGGRRSEPERL